MASETSISKWESYVAAAYLQRVSRDSGQYHPGKGSKIYRRYSFTIDAVMKLAACGKK